jgi:hypothetical protein
MLSNGTVPEMFTPEEIRQLEWLIWGLSGIFVAMSSFFSFALIYMHLKNWTIPDQQKYIVRLLLMVPIYSIDSWLSLRWINYAIYFDIARDCYEAYVIYQFFALLTSYIEGNQPGILFKILEDKPSVKFPFPFCCFPSFKPSPLFLVITKQCILQYVVIKPVTAIIAACLEATGHYNEGNFLPWYGYVYVTVIALASVLLSMYFLVWFYLTTEEEMRPFSPVAKFICIKAILFFSFWQSVTIALMAYFSFIPESVGSWKQEHIARGLQDFIICIEMFILSVAHGYVFSYKRYEVDRTDYFVSTEEPKPPVNPVSNLKQVINQKDVVIDITATYSPNTLIQAKKQHKEVKKIYELKKKFNQLKSDQDIPLEENDDDEPSEDVPLKD